MKKCKDRLKLEKEKRFHDELDSILNDVDPLMARSISTAKEKSASAWLNSLPLKQMGYVLNKQEFRDAIHLR